MRSRWAARFLLLRLLVPLTAMAVPCPRGITSFSNGPQASTYYECVAEGQTPILKSCRPGEKYWPSKKSCFPSRNLGTSKESEYSDLTINSRPVLGDPVRLGDFYNSNTGERFNGYSMWNKKTVEKEQTVEFSASSSVDVFEAASTFERLKRGGYPSHVILDVLRDALQLQGNSKFLTDRLSSEKQALVVLTYSATTEKRTLPVSIPPDFDYCGRTDATHVISSVTFGTRASFVFRKTVGEGETKEEVMKLLLAAVIAIKEERSDMDDSIKKILKDIHVNFYSDFVRDKEPGNYEESVKMYKTLPLRAGNPNKTVTVLMELMPITKYCTGKVVTHIAIAEDVLRSVNQMLSNVEMSKLTIKTLRLEQSTLRYRPLIKIFQKLLAELTYFDLRMKSDLHAIIPRIHTGNASESDLVKLLQKYETSPFFFDALDDFLEKRWRELSMLDYIIDAKKLEGTKVKLCSYKEATDIKTMFIKPYTLMLRFNILPSKDIADKYIQGHPIDERSWWYVNPLVIAAMGRTFQKFVQFSAVNANLESHGYLLAVADAKKSVTNDILTDTIEVRGQKQGLFYSFEITEAPPKLREVATSHESISFTVVHPTSTWVTGFAVSFWMQGKKDKVWTKNYEFSSSNDTEVTVDGLSADTLYECILQYYTPMGYSPTSTASEVFTRPCGPPSNLRLATLGSETVKVSWNAPVTCGAKVQITKYNVTLSGIRESKMIIINHVTTAEFVRLESGSKYIISVAAIAEKQNFNTSEGVTLSSLRSSITAVTRPDAPSQLSLVNVSTHSATLQWLPPRHVATGGVIEKYVVKYSISNDLGDMIVRGTELTLIVYNTSCQLSDLVQGTTYVVSVQVLTSKGDSDQSAKLFVKTRFVKGELDTLNDAMNHSILSVERELKEELNHHIDEVNNHFDMNDFLLKSFSNSTISMVYYPRLRREQLDIDRNSGCGGIINTPGQESYDGIHYRYYGSQHYYAKSGCTWNVNTGLPTTLIAYLWGIDSSSYVYVYDEYTLVKKTYSSFGSIHLKSGNGFVKFKSGNQDQNHFGIVIHIQVTEVKRMAAHRYYPKYKASFTGYGSPRSSSEHHTIEVPKTNSSVPACIKDCRERYLHDTTWSIVAIELDTEPLQCSCYKNPQGFQYSFSKFQYRLT